MYGSQSVNSRIGLGFKKYVGPEAREDNRKSTKAGLEHHVKEGKLHVVPGPIRGEFMPSDSDTSDFDGSHHLYGKKSTDLSDPISNDTDFVSCSDSDKSSDQGSTSYDSCDSSIKSDLPKTKTLPKTTTKTTPPPKSSSKSPSVAAEDLSLNSFKNNNFNFVKKNSCHVSVSSTSTVSGSSLNSNKSSKKKTCFVCGSKFHLIKDCTYHESRMGACVNQQKPRKMWQKVNQIPPYVPQYVHADSRFNSADSRFNSADRPSSSNWRQSYARPYVGPTSTYFNQGYWPGYYEHMTRGLGYWDYAAKSSADCSWKKQGPKFIKWSKNNGGSHTSTWPNSKIHKAGSSQQ